MSTLYKETSYSLKHLVEAIEQGNIALPDIQRPFVWTPALVRDLFDSMYRGYPVGSLMFWATAAEVGVRQVGGENTERVASQLIVDGQQRLTSLYAVLTGRPVVASSFRKFRIQIAFRPDNETFSIADAATREDPKFVQDISALWKTAFKAEVQKFIVRLEQACGEELGDDEQNRLEERLDRVRDLRDFRFQVIEIDAGAQERQVCDIFFRSNSKGVKPKQSDFILTLMSVHWEAGRRQIEAFCRSAVETKDGSRSPKYSPLDPSPDQIVRAAVGLAFGRGRLQDVYSILRGKDLNTGEISAERRTAQFEALRQAVDAVVNPANWQEFLTCLTRAGFRSARMIASDNAIIFSYVLWLIGKFWMDRDALQELISRWFFMVHTTGRYNLSPETKFEEDLRYVNEAGDAGGFRDAVEREILATFTDDYWNRLLPVQLDTSETASPNLLAFWAALNLLDADVLLGTAKMCDLLDPTVTSRKKLERHRLFPKAHLAQQGITDPRQVNAAANMAFVHWPENSGVGTSDPREYWPRLTENLPSATVEQHCRWHALPNDWEQLDYQEFLKRRRKLMAQVIKKGFKQLCPTAVPPSGPAKISDLIKGGEGQSVEFKAAARWNMQAQKVDKRIEHVIAKTVCGFLNVEGGTLLIGVQDDGSVVGVDSDLRSLRGKPNLDGYEQFLVTLLGNVLTIPIAGVVQIRFERQVGKDICVVTVKAAPKPVFAKGVSGGELMEFWVRIGNTTKQLHGNEMLDHIANRWN